MPRLRIAAAPVRRLLHRCGLLFSLLVALIPGANAAPTIAWTTKSPGGTVDAGYHANCGAKPMLLDAVGNAIVVRMYGVQSFLSIAKFDPDGNLLWRVDDVSEPRTHIFYNSGSCMAALDASGNVVVASGADKSYLFGNHGFSTVKYSGVDGSKLWGNRSHNFPLAIRGLAVDAQGDVFALARDNADSFIAKFRGADGAPAWPARRNSEVATSAKYSMLALGSQGDAVVASTSAAMKLSGPSGDTVWTGVVPRLGTLDFESSWDYLVPDGLVVDAAGDVLLVKGENTAELSLSPTRRILLRDYLTVKLSGTTGTAMWSGLPQSISRYEGPALRDDAPTGIAVDAAGNVIVHGRSQAGGHESQHYDFATLKLDAATGSPVWTALPDGASRYNGLGNHRDSAAAVTTDAGGDVYVTGGSTSAAGDEDILTRKYSGVTGQPLWSGLPDFAAIHDGALGSSDAGEGVSIDASGNVFVVGREAGAENDDQVLLRHDGATGATIWSARSEPTVARFEKLYDTQTRTTIVDANGNTFVAGGSFNGYCSDWLVMKVAPNGERLWTKRFNSSRAYYAHSCGLPYAIALDADGDVFVTGELRDRIATAKFSGIDGSPLWTDLTDSVATHEPLHARSGYYAGLLLAVDSQGDVVVAAGLHPYGYIRPSFVYTLKYDGDTGTRLWVGQHGQLPYYGANRMNADPTALVIDAQDHVFITAAAPNNQTYEDVATIKYDGASGLPLWDGLPDGAAIFPCSRPVMALDPAQNPIVACSADDGNAPLDFATIKYSGATGTPLWTQRTDGSVRYASPGDGHDYVEAIAVDSRGDIYVSGDSVGADYVRDWATVKFSGLDGKPLWPDSAIHSEHPSFDGFYRASIMLSLAGDRAFVLASHPRASAALGIWSVHDARTGARLHTQTLPAGTTLRAALFTSDDDLRLAGSVDVAGTQAVYVSRITGLDVSMFNSSFEDDE